MESVDTVPAPLSAAISPKLEAAEALPSELPGVDLNLGQALPEVARPEPGTAPQAGPAELGELLQESDASSPAFFTEHQALFEQALGERFAPLAAALQSFDLEEGLKILQGQG